jgi:glycosyltransferase involved in cell wall biosynthesis
MGSLKPILGTSVPRLIEVYQNAPRFIVKPNEPEKLASKIMWLKRNYELAVAYASSLYAYAVRTQWIRMAGRHTLLYTTLLSKREQTSPP